MRKIILTLLMLMASSGILMADAVSFDATVNSSRVSMDEALQLTLTITGGNENLDPVSLPVIDGFTAKYLGPSTSISIVNGDYHSERSFIYNLFPNKVGKFQIPAISATIAGQTYRTHPIDVEIFENSNQASSGTSSQNQGPSPESLKDKILVVASTDSTEVYLNQRIPLTIKLLINDIPVRDMQYPQFDKTGFLVDDMEKPEQGAQLIDGVRYDSAEFKTNVYPNRLGDLTFGPVQIMVDVLYKNAQNNPFDQGNNLFGTDAFNNFFDSYSVSPMTKSSEPIHFHVLPLPIKDRPNDFTGAIGESFDFQASVSPSALKAGDPLTLKMDVKGNGNFKNFKMPVFQASGFKSYAPQIKESDDEKKTEIVIIPTSAQIKEVPTLRFSYFDPIAKEYKTITRGPFPIQVSAPSPEQEFKAVGFADISREPLTQTSNQFSVGKILHKILEFIGKLSRSIWFWVSMGFLLMAGIFYFIWRSFQNRLENDPAFARRLKAVREARQALKPAESYISTGKTKEFYALLSKVIRDYLANKWHQSSAALSVVEISNHLKTSKIDEAHILLIKTVLEQSDLVCFAGANLDASQMNSDLKQTQYLIEYFEKFLK